MSRCSYPEYALLESALYRSAMLVGRVMHALCCMFEPMFSRRAGESERGAARPDEVSGGADEPDSAVRFHPSSTVPLRRDVMRVDRVVEILHLSASGFGRRASDPQNG
jgi:hypothetical protein